MAEETGTTLRDSLNAAVEQHTEPQEAPPAVEQQATESPESKPGRTAGRERDEKGRLLPGKVDKAPEAPQAAPQAPAAPAKPRPSSWKKDYEQHWTKIASETPELADYLTQREQDFAKGVSTYKQEWEKAKPYIDAVTPFLPLLQQHGIDPSQWIGNLGSAHRTLAMGSPQEKLQAFQKLASDYGVPVQQMFVQGQDGRFYWNQAPQIQQQAPQPDVQKLVQEQFEDYQTKQEIARFSADKENHPHYEEVKATMAGLLQSGLADDLESAYQAALRMPQHSQIYEAMQEQQRHADEEKRRAEAAAQVQTARAKVVSVKSATPTQASGGGKKGLREQLAEAVDQALGGRV